MSDIVPTFNMDSYKNGLITPAVWWAVLQVLWLILGFIDSTDNFLFPDISDTTYLAFSMFSIEILLLFGAWAGISVAKAGGNAGDGLIAGLLLGIAAWILWMILFGFIDPASDNLDFADDLLPRLWYFMLVHAAGSVTVSGIMTKD